MSADRENHDMTHKDIALLLADAADEVEIGIAPYQAVIRGGRRRRARRLAVAAATALVLCGSTGATLALAGLPGGDGDRVAPVATRPTAPVSPEERHVYAPQRTTLATGTDQGRTWQVYIDVWGVPRDESEARRQLDAMRAVEEEPTVRQAADLVGKTSYFVGRSIGGKSLVITFDTVKKMDPVKDGFEAESAPLEPGAAGPERLVVGRVGKGAREVMCKWQDGTTSVARKAFDASDDTRGQGVIRPAAGTPVNWFVCLAPSETGFESAEVVK
ncbi:hypothetical protein NGF19_22750 [Streptomyces sp. RY43-2]|uniref:Uncharacterized protein n=1 Tax=Streptomyces macrolidinus TaxID=2952607 RepID=A0ABT0ZJ57_9ACTN|nr:hypothetical protein [Streptomyces macrolidinus]MCN9243572.1 hypothetical protein [Streptomyces macrolidinus]